MVLLQMRTLHPDYIQGKEICIPVAAGMENFSFYVQTHYQEMKCFFNKIVYQETETQLLPLTKDIAWVYLWEAGGSGFGLQISQIKLGNWIAFRLDISFMILNYHSEVKIKQKEQLLPL